MNVVYDLRKTQGEHVQAPSARGCIEMAQLLNVACPWRKDEVLLVTVATHCNQWIHWPNIFTKSILMAGHVKRLGDDGKQR